MGTGYVECVDRYGVEQGIQVFDFGDRDFDQFRGGDLFLLFGVGSVVASSSAVELWMFRVSAWLMVCSFQSFPKVGLIGVRFRVILRSKRL